MRERRREGELYIGSSVTPLWRAVCVGISCGLGNNCNETKRDNWPARVVFARLLLRLLISVNREGSFVCCMGRLRVLSLGSLCACQIHVKLVCGFVRSIDTACQMSKCGSHPDEKVLNWQKVKTQQRIVKNTMYLCGIR